MTTLIRISSHLDSLPINNKRVFLRADLNVPLQNGTIINDYRLRATLPTIQKIVARGGRVILATHLGRPTHVDENLSTKHLIPWLTKEGFNVIFEPNLERAQAASLYLESNDILLLENLRFFPGEKNNTLEFAQQLFNCADFYVNDAFAVVHRSDTSITLLPSLFIKEHRTVGPLITYELAMLNKLLDDPARPFVLALGGGKVHDKIPLLKNLINYVNTILLCPAISATFLKALGQPTGKSLVDESALPICTEIITQAKRHGIELVFPLDYLVAENNFNGPLSYASAQDFPANGMAITLGKKSTQLYSTYIQRAGTIFYNGAMGDARRPETLSGMKELLHAMAVSKAYSVVGGGDSVAAAELIGIGANINHLSTGGGATLAYLSGEKLPGLELFLDSY